MNEIEATEKIINQCDNVLLAEFNLGYRIEYFLHVSLHALHHNEQVFSIGEIFRCDYIQNFNGKIISGHLT